MSFKERIYVNYFKNQASRSVGDPELRIRKEAGTLKKDLGGLLPSDKKAKTFELGAGFGVLQKFLHDQGYTEAIGIDISVEQVELAKKLGIESVEQGDALKVLKESEGGYDIIVGNDFLEHFERDEVLDILELIREKLAPGGKAIFRCPNIDSPMGSVYAYGDVTHGLFLNKSSADQLMTAAGFRNVDIRSSAIMPLSGLKGLLQKFLWWSVRMRTRVDLFATGHSQSDAVLTPNLLIIGEK